MNTRDILNETRGRIFNIQRYSLNDGPGIRTVIFFKGCPLRCEWCCNSESVDAKPHLMHNFGKCLGCGRCAQACPNEARNDGKYISEKCSFCGKCVEVCPTGALELFGGEKSIGEILDAVEKDRLFYESSGGGVTLSGGEVLMQKDFALALMGELQMRYFHMAIETTGYAPWSHVEEIVDRCDLVLYDLKHMDTRIHRQYTGVPNELILENALKAAKKKEVIFRVPLIGGVNDCTDNIENVARFALKAGVREVHLLPYHRLGESKYSRLGRAYVSKAFTPDEKTIESLEKLLTSYGIKVMIGG